MIRESLLNKKLWIFDSRIKNDSQINDDLRINLESNHFKKDSNQLSFSVSPKNSNEIRIIDSGSQQALFPATVSWGKIRKEAWLCMRALRYGAEKHVNKLFTAVEEFPGKYGKTSWVVCRAIKRSKHIQTFIFFTKYSWAMHPKKEQLRVLHFWNRTH